MNLATSSDESIDNSDNASLFTSSRSMILRPLSTGSPVVQSASASITGVVTAAESKRIGSRLVTAFTSAARSTDSPIIAADECRRLTGHHPFRACYPARAFHLDQVVRWVPQIRH